MKRKKDFLKLKISGYDVLIDVDDVQILIDYTWHVFRNRDKIYMRGWNKTTKKKVLMHRVIMDAPKNLMVDHKNQNTLDNRKSNLRLCKNSHNICNRPKPKNNKSGYKGVSKCNLTKKWKASITKDYKRHHLGLFDTKEEAAEAYNIHATKLHGEFACLNDIVKEVGSDEA
jgi:hypothetical protein